VIIHIVDEHCNRMNEDEKRYKITKGVSIKLVSKTIESFLLLFYQNLHYKKP